MTLHFCCRDQLISHVNAILKQEDTNLLAMACKCLGFLAAFVTLAAVSLIVSHKTIVNDPIWIENILVKCNYDSVSLRVTDMFETGLGFGAYFGLIYHAKMCPGMLSSQST